MNVRLCPFEGIMHLIEHDSKTAWRKETGSNPVRYRHCEGGALQ